MEVLGRFSFPLIVGLVVWRLGGFPSLQAPGAKLKNSVEQWVALGTGKLTATPPGLVVHGHHREEVLRHPGHGAVLVVEKRKHPFSLYDFVRDAGMPGCHPKRTWKRWCKSLGPFMIHYRYFTRLKKKQSETSGNLKPRILHVATRLCKQGSCLLVSRNQW